MSKETSTDSFIFLLWYDQLWYQDYSLLSGKKIIQCMLFTCKVFKFFNTFLAAIFFRGMTHIRTDLYLLYIVISFKPNPHFFQTSFSITVRITLHLLSKVYQYTIRNNHLPVTNPIIVELNTFIYVVYNSIGETIKGFVTTLHIQQLP